LWSQRTANYLPVPVDEGDIRQITDGSARDRGVDYSPDGKWIAYISDSSGREELYVVATEGGTPQKLTDIDALKAGFQLVTGFKRDRLHRFRQQIAKVNVSTRAVMDLDSSRYGNVSTPEWSPDGKWVAYSKSDSSRTSDIYILDSTGADKTPHKVTFDSYNDGNPRFGPDGRKLYFVRSEATGAGGLGNASTQIYSVWLEKLDRDPDDPEERPDAEAAQAPAGDGTEGAGPPRRPAGPRPPHETKMDWAGMRHRTRQITRMPFPVFNYTIAPDSRTIVFVTTEPAGAGSTPIIYSIQDDGRRLARVTAWWPTRR
jgi:tricorn protease